MLHIYDFSIIKYYYNTLLKTLTMSYKFYLSKFTSFKR